MGRVLNLGPTFMHGISEGIQNLPEQLVQDFMSEREKYVLVTRFENNGK